MCVYVCEGAIAKVYNGKIVGPTRKGWEPLL